MARTMRVATVAPTTLTVREVATVLRCGRKAVHRMIRRGRLRAVWVGHQYRIPRAALDTFLSAPLRPKAPRGARH